MMISSLCVLFASQPAAADAGAWEERLRGFTAHSVEADPAHVRLVFIGDTGADAVEPGTDSSHITAPRLTDLRASVRAEGADAIFGLGDLVYGVGGPLELSPRCTDPTRGRAAALLPQRLGAYYADLGADAWLVLGNHDVGHYRYSEARARCMMAYADQTDHLSLPSAWYSVDFGLARVVVADTNRDVSGWDPDRIIGAYRDDAWNILVGHHVLRAAFDKEDEAVAGGKHDIRGWLLANSAEPDLWVNGHAHFLQFGVYDDIPAATSGSGSKVRVRDTCPGSRCPDLDAPSFSRSEYGYAVVDLTNDRMVMRLKNTDGDTLFCWVRGTDVPAGAACDPDLDPAAPAGPLLLSDEPPCEPSAALRLDPASVLFADNEEDEVLYRARYTPGRPHSPPLSALAALPLHEADGSDSKIKDIEAITAWGDDILVVGSHSHKKWSASTQSCPTQDKRRRIARYSVSADALVEVWRTTTSDSEWDKATASRAACASLLFSGARDEDSSAFCAALVEVEQAARGSGPVAEAACAAAMNIEGATVVSDRAWIGLRGPLVPGRGAPLLRLAAGQPDASMLSLDAVAWIRFGAGLEDHGVRELTLDGDTLLGVAGPMRDAAGAPFILWSIPAADLVPGATLDATIIDRSLPSSSEGLALGDDELVILIDGDQPGSGARACREPSQQLRLPWSTP